LRLDEDEKAGAGLCYGYCGRDYLPDRDERNINHHESTLSGGLQPQFARIPLDWNNARNLAQFPVKLFHVYVDGIDTFGALLEQQSVKPPLKSDIEQNHPRAQSQSLPARLRFVPPRLTNLCTRLMLLCAHLPRRAFPPFPLVTVHLNFTGENHSHGFLRRCRRSLARREEDRGVCGLPLVS